MKRIFLKNKISSRIYFILSLLFLNTGYAQTCVLKDCDLFDDPNGVYFDGLPYGYPDIKPTFSLSTFCVPIPDRGDVDMTGTAFSSSPYDNTTYFSRAGGLYPGGTNLRTDDPIGSLDYLTGGQTISANLSADDEVVMVHVGPSVPTSIFDKFMDHYEDNVEGIKLINAGDPGLNLDAYADGSECDPCTSPCSDNDFDNDCFITELDHAMLFIASQITGIEEEYLDKECIIEACAEVDVLWVMNSVKEPAVSGLVNIDPEWKSARDRYEFGSDYNVTNFALAVTEISNRFRDYLIALDVCFPNVKMVYISPLPYEGYADQLACPTEEHPLLNAPYDYWNGWAVQEMIAQYCQGIFWDDDGSPGGPDANLDFPAYPYITWGPYFWTRGMFTPDINTGTGVANDFVYDWYDTDDHLWDCSYYDTDGFHLSTGGGGKAYGGTWLWDYLSDIDANKADGVSEWFEDHLCGGTCSFDLEYDCDLNEWVEIERKGIVNNSEVFPNPFSNSFTISFDQKIDDRSNYTIVVYDFFGNSIKELNNITTNNVIFELEVSSGIYLYSVYKDDIQIANGRIVRQ